MCVATKCTPSAHHVHGKGNDVAKMESGATINTCQKENFTIIDEVGNDVFLVNRRVFEGIATPIMPLAHLTTQGWKIKIAENGNQRFMYMLKDGARLTFVEKGNNLH